MDNFAFEDFYDPRSGSRKLKSEDVARVLGIISSIYLVKTIGGEVYDPKRTFDYVKHTPVARVPEKEYGLVDIDLSFVDDVDDWDYWKSRTRPPTLKKYQSDPLGLHKSSDDPIFFQKFDALINCNGQTSSHVDGSRDSGATLEDGSPIFKSSVHYAPSFEARIASVQYPYFIASNEPTVQEKARQCGTTWDIAYLTDYSGYEDVVDNFKVVSPVGSSSVKASTSGSPSFSAGGTSVIIEKHQADSEVDSTPQEMSSTSEEYFSARSQLYSSESTEEYNSIMGSGDEALDAGGLFSESDEDSESNIVSDSE